MSPDQASTISLQLIRILFITRRDIIQPLQQEQATQQVTLFLELLYILKIPPVLFIFREDMLYMVSRLITGFSRNIIDINTTLN